MTRPAWPDRSRRLILFRFSTAISNGWHQDGNVASGPTCMARRCAAANCWVPIFTAATSTARTCAAPTCNGLICTTPIYMAPTCAMPVSTMPICIAPTCTTPI